MSGDHSQGDGEVYPRNCHAGVHRGGISATLGDRMTVGPN
jgi:hypothetical protein